MSAGFYTHVLLAAMKQRTASADVDAFRHSAIRTPPVTGAFIMVAADLTSARCVRRCVMRRAEKP
jgi:hypothetical protein